VYTIISYLLMITVLSDTVIRWNYRKDHDRMHKETVSMLLVVGPLSQHIPGNSEKSTRYLSQNRLYSGRDFK